VGELIRVLHVDPFPVARAGLRAALAASADIRVVAQARCIVPALASAGLFKPDVTITEIDVPDEDSCFAAMESLRQQGSDTKVVVYTRFPDERYAERARTAGACGYVTKDASLDTLLRAIREVMAGHRFFAGEQADQPVVEVAPHLVEPTRRLLDLLSPRELEVAKLLALGLSVKQIAAALHRSPKTIETHTTHLMAKLSVHDRVALSHLAIREGLVPA
jgi:two-component system invasion response regulator UvrY